MTLGIVLLDDAACKGGIVGAGRGSLRVPSREMNLYESTYSIATNRPSFLALRGNGKLS